jgi:hypothetical protein
VCYTTPNIRGERGDPPPTTMEKFVFRIRTRQGMVVENLTIYGRDEADAERKLRQMYLHCEIVDRSTLRPARKVSASSFEDVLSLISK